MMTPQASLLILLLQYLYQICDANCTPSSCGIITSISSPFRLKGDPKRCGDRRFELECKNNVTSLFLKSHKYYVKHIDYLKSTIRLVDASINSDDICSFPNSSAYYYSFTFPYSQVYPYRVPNLSDDVPLPVNLMSCPYPLKNSSLVTDISHCQTSSSRFSYVKVGRMTASEVKHMCRVEVMVMTSWRGVKDSNNATLEEIHNSLLYGFELVICPGCRVSRTAWDKFGSFLVGLSPILLLIVGLIFALVSPPVLAIVGFTAVLTFLCFVAYRGYVTTLEYRNYVDPQQIEYKDYALKSASTSGFIFIIIVAVPRFIIFPLVVWFLIYIYRRRHLSMFDSIESFLQSDNKLMPIRYTYSDIKRMTKNFQDKLGEGGYGSVYKGKLRSGHHVAVKLLGKSGTNGQDFINEIATIGMIHHVNIVKLVGYCAQDSKRALVFDCMPNGSLEKYIFNLENSNSLSWDTKFDIAVGVACGIDYLHRGCDVQILHFDIKPHNILLDAKFIPKISDFGLAKLCSTEKTAVTLTAARGTIGYVAPELINRGLGRVSHKADVYSFGMLLMEIVTLKRDLIGNNDGSSKYFPCRIYDCFNEGRDSEITKIVENDNDDDGNMRRLVRKMTIVALWCIQMNPNDRPSMNKVLEMLESDIKHLQLPDYPSNAAEVLINEDQAFSSNSTSLLHNEEGLSHVEITVQQ